MITSLITAAVTPVGPDATSDSLFSLDPFVVTMLLGTLIPAAIALATKASTDAWVKKLLTLILSGVAGVLTVGLQDGGGSLVSVSSLKSAGLAFISAVAAYFGLLRNSEVETKLQEIGPADTGGT